MRKITGLLFALIFLLILASPVTAAETTTYTIDDLHMTIDLPAPMCVVTRNAVYNRDILDAAAVDLSVLQKNLTDNYIYLNAISDDYLSELYVIMYTDTDTERFWDSRDNDGRLQLLATQIISLNKKQGITSTLERIYNAPNATYIVMQHVNASSAYGRQYYTVINGQGISVTIWNYAGPMTEEDLALQDAAVASVVYAAKEKPAGMRGVFANSLLQALPTALFAGLFTALFVLLLFFMMRRYRIRGYLTSSLAGPTDAPDVMFQYRNKYYHAEPYIQRLMSELKAVNSPKLTKRAAALNAKIARSANPSVLDQLMLDAISRVLQQRSATWLPQQQPAYPQPPVYPQPPPVYSPQAQASSAPQQTDPLSGSAQPPTMEQ